MLVASLWVNNVHSIHTSFTKYYCSPYFPQKKHITTNINRVQNQSLDKNKFQHAILGWHIPPSRHRLGPKARHARGLTRQEPPGNHGQHEGEDRDPTADRRSRREQRPVLRKMWFTPDQALLQQHLSAPESHARLAARGERGSSVVVERKEGCPELLGTVSRCGGPWAAGKHAHCARMGSHRYASA